MEVIGKVDKDNNITEFTRSATFQTLRTRLLADLAFVYSVNIESVGACRPSSRFAGAVAAATAPPSLESRSHTLIQTTLGIRRHGAGRVGRSAHTRPPGRVRHRRVGGNQARCGRRRRRLASGVSREASVVVEPVYVMGQQPVLVSGPCASQFFRSLWRRLSMGPSERSGKRLGKVERVASRTRSTRANKLRPASRRLR